MRHLFILTGFIGFLMSLMLIPQSFSTEPLQAPLKLFVLTIELITFSSLFALGLGLNKTLAAE